LGSLHRWFLYAIRKTDAPHARRDCAETVDAPELSSRPRPTKVSAAVFAKAEDQARAKRSRRGRHSRRCRHETAQSDLGCPRIAEQANLAFGTSVNKDVVRRILAQHFQSLPIGSGPSWLTFLGQTKDSLWSLDLIRCESVALRTYWVLVVLDQYTRRIIGFGIQAGIVDGLALCRMFKDAIRGETVPKYLSSDHDPLYRFHQWQANLRILSITEIKTVPDVPLSHPFVERLIGTIRRECLDRLLFWTATDLELKLSAFKQYYNRYRTHAALEGQTPVKTPESRGISLKSYRWKKHCRGLYQTPIAA
jgi:putative transposase